jgi:hypothetical protein
VTKLTIDLADPNNPIAKVRKVNVIFTAEYSGENAWNTNSIVKQLEKDLRDLGKFNIKSYRLNHAYDADGKEITEDEMREYLYRKHGHTSGKCSNCPDPIKWAEVERLRRMEFYENKKVWDDMRKGRPGKGYNWANGEIQNKKIYVHETEQERAIRVKNGSRVRGRPKKIEQPFTLWDEEVGTDNNVEPRLQHQL